VRQVSAIAPLASKLMMRTQVLLLSQNSRLHGLGSLLASVPLTDRSNLNCRPRGRQRQVPVQLADD
jgi:hypothetical protein